MTDTTTPDTTPAAVEAMIERLLAGDLCTVELAPEAAAMLREVARERDAWAQSIAEVHEIGREWGVDAVSAPGAAAQLAFKYHKAKTRALAAEAEAAALREALREIEALEIDWRLSTAENMRAASRIARAALKVSGHD